MELLKDRETIGWLVGIATAIGTGIGAVITAVFNARRGRNQDRADSKRTLSQSEGEFREDVLERLDKTERALDECRTSHQECREQTIVLRGEVSLLNDKLTELEQSQAQASLALR